MTHQLIREQFYPLTSTIIYQLCDAELTGADWKIWLYLTSIDPWGDRYCSLDLQEIMSRCRISRATLYRGIDKLRRLGFFDFKDQGVKIRNLSGISNLRQQSQNCESDLKNETAISEMRQDSQFCENESPKLLPSQASSSSQTLQNNSEDIHTLSEAKSVESERTSHGAPPAGATVSSAKPKVVDWRERVDKNQTQFKSFCEQAASRLPVKPVLIDSWISNNFDELWQLYQESLTRDVVSNTANVDKQDTRRTAHGGEATSPPVSSSYIPQGDWLVDGKLDGEFLDWMINLWLQSYANRYGSDRAAVKADVLSHFVNQPAKLAIRWQQYLESPKKKVQPNEKIITYEGKQHPEIEAGLADGRITKLDPHFDALWTSEGHWMEAKEWLKQNSQDDQIDQTELEPSSVESESPSEQTEITRGVDQQESIDPPPDDSTQRTAPDAEATSAPVSSSIAEITTGLFQFVSSSGMPPSNKLEEYQQWLSAPELREEAVVRLRQMGYQNFIYNELGEPIAIDCS